MLTAEEKKLISLAPFNIPALFDIHLENNLPLIQEFGHPHTHAKGHMLFRPEETVETIHFLTKGIIAESTSNANGLEKLTLVFPLSRSTLCGTPPAAHRLYRLRLYRCDCHQSAHRQRY